MKTKSEGPVWEREYVLLVNHPLSYIRTAIETGPLQLERLRREYRHPMAADLWRVRKNEKLPDDDTANAWLVDLGLDLLKEWIEVKGNDVRLKVGYLAEDLRYRGKPVKPAVAAAESVFDQPFNPARNTGVFADNIRAKGPDDLDELRESMKTFGWIPYHPALVDELDVIIVGHRRLKVAEELGIPVREGKEIIRLDLGSGDAADAERLRFAIASNLGGKPLNIKDRKKIAKRLYGEEGWSQQRIADMLDVSKMTIQRDVLFVTPGTNKRTEKRGRTKGPPLPPAVKAALDKAKDTAAKGEEPTARKLRDEGFSETHSKQGMIALAAQQELDVSDDDPYRQFAQESLDAQPKPMTRNDLVSHIVVCQRYLDQEAER